MVFYFLGVDPAPSESHRSDDGAAVVLRATPRNPPEDEADLSNNPSDWWRDLVYARRYRKLRSREWAGHIHQLHHRFGFARICMDPGGGGTFIMRDLASNRQPMGAAGEQDVTPIVGLDEKGVVVGHFILSMFKRADPAIDEVWPGLAGDDQLVDAVYSVFKEGLESAEFGFPPPWHEWDKAELERWTDERRWALRNLTALQEQLKNIIVATKEDGSFLFTRRNARQFSAKGKKDLVSAALYANAAFLSWLKGQDGQWHWRREDEAMCCRIR